MNGMTPEELEEWMKKQKARGAGEKPKERVTWKLLGPRFRKAVRGQSTEDVMEVLTDSFGDKNLARVCLSYLAESSSFQAESHKIIKWFYFACGVGITTLFGVLVKVFS